MTEAEIVQHMIHFIEEKEHQLHIQKFASDGTVKDDVVKSILDELERVVADEN